MRKAWLLLHCVEATGPYVHCHTGALLPAWDQTLDAIGPDDDPVQAARFGPRFDAHGGTASGRWPTPHRPLASVQAIRARSSSR